MLSYERQEKILEYLRQNKTESVTGLSKKLFIGEATIRRDLEKLKGKGYISRIYGGAVLREGLDSEIPLLVREKERMKEKNLIGSLAAGLINEGDIIMMDSSSTTYCMVEHMKSKKQLTVITNGAKTAISLGETLHTKVFCTGGRLREHSLSYTGETAQKFTENFYADKMFFSCRAISYDKGIMDSSEDEAELRKVMLRHANQVILLCDSNKFNKTAFYKICDMDKINIIVTDARPSSELLEIAEKDNIEIIFSGK